MKKILLWTIGVIAVLAIVGSLLPERPDDSNEQQAAIVVIKKSFAPSAQLLAWSPDFAEAQWVAIPYPQPLCTHSDCYQVSLWVDIIPGGEKKTVKAQWIVYAGNTKYQADNAEARTLFVPAAAPPSSGDASQGAVSRQAVSSTGASALPSLTSKLTALSHTAQVITGDIEYSSSNTITMLNKNYPSALVRVLGGKEVEDAARLFSIRPPAPDSSALRALYRIYIPAEEKLLNGNTICGNASAKWIVYLNPDVWNMAFFSSDTEPRLETEENLCGTFRYQHRDQ